MVANPCNSFNSDNFLTDYCVVYFPSSSFHLSVGVNMKEQLKKIKDISFKFFNFFFLIPVYFIGIGISNLLWRLSKKDTRKINYWIQSKELDRSIKNHEESY
jgi:hypothetical protein